MGPPCPGFFMRGGGPRWGLFEGGLSGVASRVGVWPCLALLFRGDRCKRRRHCWAGETGIALGGGVPWLGSLFVMRLGA